MNKIDIMNRSIPIPDRYTQYPGGLPPSEIYGGTWELTFNDSGVFFRTEGGYATPFGAGIQQSQNRPHRHSLGHGSARGTLGAWNNDFGGSLPYGFGYNLYTARELLTLMDTDGDAESRPVNVTIRVWKKVAA